MTWPGKIAARSKLTILPIVSAGGRRPVAALRPASFDGSITMPPLWSIVAGGPSEVIALQSPFGG
jgi:hypothetical protein